jgi:hypothetical protein
MRPLTDKKDTALTPSELRAISDAIMAATYPEAEDEGFPDKRAYREYIEEDAATTGAGK